MARTARYTIADLEALPYDEWNRYELIDGEILVTTAPDWHHQLACSHTWLQLHQWSSVRNAGLALINPGVVFAVDQSVIPDIVWVRRERQAEVLDPGGRVRAAPDLIVEVLSPGSENQERDRERPAAQ